MVVTRFLNYIFQKKSLFRNKSYEYYLYDTKLSYKERYALYKRLKRRELYDLVEIKGVLSRFSLKWVFIVFKNIFIVPFRKPFIYFYWYFRDMYNEHMSRKTFTYGNHPEPRIIECLIDDYKELVKNSRVWGGYTYIKQLLPEKDKETGKFKYNHARINHLYRGACSFVTHGLSGPNRKLKIIDEWMYSMFYETSPLYGGFYNMLEQTEYNEENYYEPLCIDEMFEYGAVNYEEYADAYMYESNQERKRILKLLQSGKFTFTSEDEYFEQGFGYMREDSDYKDFEEDDFSEYDEDEEDCECHYNSNPGTELERDYLYTSINYVHFPARKEVVKLEEKYKLNTWWPVFMRSFCVVTFPFVIYTFYMMPEYFIFDYSDKYVWREGYIMDDIIQEYDAIMEEFKEYGKYGGWGYILLCIFGIYAALELGCTA